ncbi:MAG TPA: HipA domain-containing protein [Egicoccus sp.]|nr:HipA domain-containing protein [Egicoccus sp.]HSK24814.1 HipA domain-containing protein [Egicoccus sp.]
MNTDLHQLRGVEVADVYVGDVLAAQLRRTSAGTSFRYLDDYLAGGGPPVATTLPLAATEVLTPAGALPPFFAGLLPEGRRLLAVRAAVKTSADDELTLLLAVGGDAVGHARVVPAGASPAPDEPGPPEVDASEQVSFRELFRAAVGSDAALLDRVALPGVQDKISGRMIAFPVAGSRRQFLLKLNPPEFPHLVENEAFFLEAARRSGLPVANAELVRDRDGEVGLLVERFDRLPVADRLVRVAQEDACQVLGRYPADKYLVTTEEVVRALASVTDAPVVAARDLLRQVAFAYLTGNGDAHAKNFSVLRLSSGEWRVSPAYDLPSSHPYGDTTMALSIDGRIREDVTWRSFVAAADAVGVPERAVRRMLADLTERVDRWLPDLDSLPFDERRRHRLARLVADRRTKLTPT